MRYRFTMVCPVCDNISEVYGDKFAPHPKVSCGDCLMDRMQVNHLKVVNVHQVDEVK